MRSIALLLWIQVFVSSRNSSTASLDEAARTLLVYVLISNYELLLLAAARSIGGGGSLLLFTLRILTDYNAYYIVACRVVARALYFLVQTELVVRRRR